MQPGDVIDSKYRIEVQLGEGGMGRVLAASHLALGNTVAIKLLKRDALKYPDVPSRFLREARAACRLRNEHVVRVLDVGQLASGEPFMVMEMLEGHDLASRLRDGPVPAPLAVEYIVQACEGLAEAHACGMVHRDIKPANLFVTQRTNGMPLIKVLDFGIATAAYEESDHRLTTTTTVIGSPSYMSPEQLRAARDADQRSDIWSLGVTLYELVSGRQPFVAPTITALTLKIVGEPHPPIEGIPEELMSIIDICLAKEPDQRFQNVAELAAALAPLFPHGRTAADLVAASLMRPVPPLNPAQPAATLAEPAVYPQGTAPAVWESTSTTAMSSGESAPLPVPSRRRAWIAVAGVAVTAAAVVVGLVLSDRARARRDVVPANQPPGAATQPAATPAPDLPPSPQPVVTTPSTGSAAPAVSDAETPTGDAADEKPTDDEGSKAPAKTPVKAVKKPVVKRPKQRDGRTPVEPVEYTRPADVPSDKVTKPADTTKPDAGTTPPKKLPCAPTDPRCGL